MLNRLRAWGTASLKSEVLWMPCAESLDDAAASGEPRNSGTAEVLTLRPYVEIFFGPSLKDAVVDSGADWGACGSTCENQ